MFDEKSAVIGSIVEIKVGEHKGTWKVIEKTKVNDPNNGSFSLRMKLDRNTKVAGDEIILEFLDLYRDYLYLFKPFESFDRKSKGDEWPPPMTIDVDDETYYSLIDNDDLMNTGFEGETPTGIIHHWEYENEDTTKCLSIYLKNGWIEMFIGERVLESFIEVY